MGAEFKTIRQLKEGGYRQNKAVPLFEGCWLHYNGPGSSGYGVKRTAMLLPESAMLMVGPMGCGRSGTVVAEKFDFSDRMFYLNLDDRSISLGSYIKKIPEAVEYIASLNEFKAVLICMTCLDALMGTDLQGLGKKISRKLGIPVTTTFMDPIVRDGNFGPMVQVRQAITACFEKEHYEADSVNILGTFSEVKKEDEICEILKAAGINRIKTVAGCKTFEDLRKMGNSAANIVIHPQSAASGEDLKKRLDIPFIKLLTSYNPEIISENYDKLGSLLGAELDYSEYFNRTEEKIKGFFERYKGSKIALGEAVSGNPFDIAYFLISNGIDVPFVFRDMIQKSDYEIIERLNAIAPDLRVYSGVHPSTFCFQEELPEADMVLGLDAGYYKKNTGGVVAFPAEDFNYGFGGVDYLLEILEKGFEMPLNHRDQMKGSYLTV